MELKTNLNPIVGNLDLLPVVFHFLQPFGRNGETRMGKPFKI